ncbi:fatty acid cis/trans isomerase, partial [Vibrio sp. 10N.286.51.F4]|uniref:fatty acid cis/trans isomerase n=1 Tax=Vibrio sp. 10N.286.51.F4 TaxID=3229710 RepID=UPI00354FF285
RLEGESNFLTLLPQDVRHVEQSSWYKNQSAQLSDYLQRNIAPFDQPTSVVYKTADPKRELFNMIKDTLAPVLDDRFDIVETGFGRKNEALLNQVNLIKGVGLRHVPQLVMIMIEGENGK